MISLLDLKSSKRKYIKEDQSTFCKKTPSKNSNPGL